MTVEHAFADLGRTLDQIFADSVAQALSQLGPNPGGGKEAFADFGRTLHQIFADSVAQALSQIRPNPKQA
jgi:hypothetical protein